MGTLMQDVRYALRILVKSPGFTGFAVVVLALGIAASTAIFSIADAVLVKPLPYRDAGRLVMVWEDASAFGFPQDTPAPGNFADWRARNQVFEDVAAIAYGGTFNLTGDGNPEEITGRSATANLFSLLGARPAIGRDFRAEDDVPGAPHVVMLSHGLWLRRFGGDPKIIGKELWLNNAKYTVVGVMPAGFQFPSREEDLWVPAQFTKADLANHGSHYLEVIARLKPGTRLETANANLATIAQELAKEQPETNAKIGAFAVPLREHIAGDVRSAILILLGAVGFVLLITCANVANLLLARATGRRRELALRLTLGASRARVVRQMLTESVLLSTAAGAIGLGLSLLATQFLASLIPAGIAPLNRTGINWLVLAFTMALSMATGILFGIVPALRISRVNLGETIKQGGGRGAVGPGGQRLRDVLVISEVALAIVLLAGAALLIRSFENLYHLDPGFRAEHVLSVRTPLPEPKYAQQKTRTAFYDQVLEHVSALPGVASAGYTSWVPLTNSGGATSIVIEGHTPPRPGERLIPNVRSISRDYIRAIGMRLIEGRGFEERDGAGTPNVALINQTMARKYWPGEQPLGRRFTFESNREPAPWVTIVGIVGDVHQAGLDVPARAEAYFPYQQQEFFSPSYLVVRTSGDPMLLAESVRQQIWAVDKEQPVAGVMPLEQLIDESLAPRKMQATLLGGFAGLALLLSALGIYAVLSYAVTQRTQEIGVRMALGAQSRDVLRLVVAQGIRLFLIGAAIGLTAALALAPLLGHWLYGIGANDPASFAGVTIVLAVVTFVACWLPARRATRVDPMVALRYE